MSESNITTEQDIYAPIPTVQDQEYYPLAAAQKRLYVLHEIEGKSNSTSYNLPIIFKLSGNNDKEKVENIFLELIQRHEALRTSFHIWQDEPHQKISKEVEFKLECSECDENELEQMLHAFVRPFDLGKPPLIRAKLIKIDENDFILIFDVHHIVADGITIGILSDEFVKLHNGESLNPLSLQYKDYAVWQQNVLLPNIEHQEEYWLGQFEDEILVVNIPTDYPRPSIKSFEGDSVTLVLDEELTRKINQFVNNYRVTPFMLFFAVYNVLLFQYTGQQDLVVGIPVSGRSHHDVEAIAGMFVNTLAMRNMIEAEQSFEMFLFSVMEKILYALENQDYQFEDLINALSITRDISRNPLFDTMFALQKYENTKYQLVDATLTKIKYKRKTTNFDLKMIVEVREEEYVITVEYCTKLFKHTTIQRFTEHYNLILKQILNDPGIRIIDIDILTEKEKHQLLYEFNDTKRDYPKDKTIQQLFEEQVEKTPDKVAVVFEDKRLTYQQLNEKANQLARVLQKKGVKPETIVGIIVERCAEMIIGIMAILKAGGAYLPIDPEYPEDRVKYMLEDSNAIVLLTQKHLRGNTKFGGEIINIDYSEIYKGNISNPKNEAIPSHVVYVIYTSGTTGKPKGVIIRHSNLVNYVTWFRNKSGLKESDKSILTSSFSFDLGYTSIFPAILNECELHIVPKEIYLLPWNLLKYLDKNGITYLKLTPTLFATIVNTPYFTKVQCETIRLVVLGGESINVGDIEKAHKIWENARFMNHYGPTEVTIGSVAKFIDLNNLEQYKNTPTIGKPIDNNKAYILDKNLKLLPVKVSGELYLGGAGVAKGYLNDEQLTNEKFIENPQIFGEKIYRTGDLACWTSDGNIEFLGRIDHQVKIRGFRVEPAEIETQLLKHEHVKETALIARKDMKGNNYLCAYYVCTSSFKGKMEAFLTRAELREYLMKRLSEYMIPSYFVQLDKLPLTPNGKIDRKALPEPAGTIQRDIGYYAPTNEIEQKLVEIWQTVLGIERIGIIDNFFELGGHSLTAINIISKIGREFDIEVPLQSIFITPTVKRMSNYILNTIRGYYEEEVPILLNPSNPKKIICFPPILGYALIYKKLAAFFDRYSLYAFNYIEDGNKIKKYTDMIIQIQPEGPYLLLGYSAGGNVAFEVVKEIERRRKQVSDIIMLDSYRRKKQPEVSKKELERFEKEFSRQLETRIPSASITKKIMDKSKKYYCYLKNLTNEGIINANIHFISSVRTDNQKDTPEWDVMTNKEYLIYQGAGTHYEMLDSDFVEKNMEIIKRIVDKSC